MAGRKFSELQNLSQSAPTGAVVGVSLSKIRGVRVTAHAPVGQAIDDGVFLAYVYHQDTARWFRMPDWDVAYSNSGENGAVMAEIPIVVDDDARLYFAASLVTTTGTPTNPAEANKVWVWLNTGEARHP